MPHPHLESKRLRTEADPFEILPSASEFLLLSSELQASPLLWATVTSVKDSKPTPAPSYPVRVMEGNHSAEG